jgi:hypothetical protein
MLLTWIDDHSFKRNRHTDEKQDGYMSCFFAACTNNKDDIKQKKTIQDYLGGSILRKSTCSHQLGSSLQLIPRECFCIVYAQRVNLFGMRAVLCLLPATCALYHVL